MKWKTFHADLYIKMKNLCENIKGLWKYSKPFFERTLGGLSTQLPRASLVVLTCIVRYENLKWLYALPHKKIYEQQW